MILKGKTSGLIITYDGHVGYVIYRGNTIKTLYEQVSCIRKDAFNEIQPSSLTELQYRIYKKILEKYY